MVTTKRTTDIAIRLLPAERLRGREIEGEFSYSHGSLRVRAGDVVSWSSSDGPFALHFGHGSPFRSALISAELVEGSKGSPCHWATKPQTVRKGNIPQGLHYVVAMCRKDAENPNRDKVFIDSCPVILDEC